jgi:hypothetical protein
MVINLRNAFCNIPSQLALITKPTVEGWEWPGIGPDIFMVLVYTLGAFRWGEMGDIVT